MTTYCFSTPHQRFTFVHLLDTHLILSCRTFSIMLATMALNHSSLRWFGTYAFTSIPRGLPHLSYSMNGSDPFFLAHWSAAEFPSVCMALVDFLIRNKNLNISPVHSDRRQCLLYLTVIVSYPVRPDILRDFGQTG